MKPEFVVCYDISTYINENGAWRILREMYEPVAYCSTLRDASTVGTALSSSESKVYVVKHKDIVVKYFHQSTDKQ